MSDSDTALPQQPSPWINWAYALVLLIFFAALGWLLYSSTLPSPESDTSPINQSINPIKRDSSRMAVLLALGAVIALGYVLGRAFEHLKQPMVVGEIVAGIILGPSLLGWLWPEGYQYLMPQDLPIDKTHSTTIVSLLGVVASLGVVLFMFLVGLEFDPQTVFKRGKTALFIAHTGIALPFVLGCGLAWLMYESGLGVEGVSLAPFALFMGVSMSITAFPILARILKEQKLTKTALGYLAIACAAIDDMTAWCLLALVIGVAQSKLGPGFQVIGLTIVYLILMFAVVKPIVTRWAKSWEEQAEAQNYWLVMMIAGALLCGWVTEWIGIHAIFGSFFLGAVIPANSKIAHLAQERLQHMIQIGLLPAFFALTGIDTNIGLISGWENILWCSLVIIVAVAGKFGGAVWAARLSGYSYREASALGVLLNTRALIELIVLSIGLKLGVISPRVYAMMVLMALFTTVMATPLLIWLKPSRVEVTDEQ